MNQRVMRSQISLCLLVLCAVLSLSARSQDAQLQITYPISNSTVPGPVIELKGVGADPSGTIEVEVLTDEWYVQTGTARINPDGSWTYAPCNLKGEGRFNNHTIRVTIIKGGKRGESTSITGVVRQS